MDELRLMATFLLQWSSEISIESNINFTCKYVNISFAVANRYGLSQYSPVGQVCGGGWSCGINMYEVSCLYIAKNVCIHLICICAATYVLYII